MHYRLELRRLGIVIQEYETDSEADARRQAQEWIEKTFDAVVILFIDGEEIRLKDTAKRLGIRGARFDNLKRYNRREPIQNILRRTGFSHDGRVRPKPTLDDDFR
jgi:hypothetical protein